MLINFFKFKFKLQLKDEECNLLVPQILRAIEIAYKLIERGEIPTADGIKRAFTEPLPLSRKELDCSNDFYNRPNPCLIQENEPNIDDFSSNSFCITSAGLSELEKLANARGRLNSHKPQLTDEDYIILYKKEKALPKVEQNRFINEYLSMKYRTPDRYNIIKDMICKKQKVYHLMNY